MGALLRRMRRFRHRFKAWRHRRREAHENRIIADQQKEIAAKVAAWDMDVRTRDQMMAELRADFDRERRELTLQIELATDRIEQLEEIICRDRARVEAEMADYIRKAEEAKAKSGLTK